MLVQADARALPLRDGCVQTCITSPPYWGLRDYGTARWEGGDLGCDHRHDTKHQIQGATSARSGRSNVESQRNENFRAVCPKCGARRIDAQLGLEPAPDAYVAAIVAVFREVRRVLRDDGTLWLNLGDSYATGAGKVGTRPGGGTQGDAWPGPMTAPNRMREVSEALELQTAIAEVLEVIAGAPAELDSVLPPLAAAAAKLCEAERVVITRGSSGARRAWTTESGHHTLEGPPSEDLADRVPGGVAFLTNRPVRWPDRYARRYRREVSRGRSPRRSTSRCRFGQPTCASCRRHGWS